MKLSLADIHCDTAYEMFMSSQSFFDNSLSISLKLTECFEKYIQVLAIWSDKRLDNDLAYFRFFQILKYLKKDIFSNASYDMLDLTDFEKDVSLIISLEDARILNNDLSRLYSVYEQGVRIITFLWSGRSCIGGAYDTDCGLTEFGRSAVLKASELGIIPDISHASLQSSFDIFDLCEGQIPVIASHSNSFKIYPHPRNLTDEQFEYVKAHGGLVGINLCREHLCPLDENTSTAIVLRHIEHYLSLGGENTVCFGCDFDGANTPNEFKNISSLSLIAEEMAKLNYNNDIINKIFYLNAKNFISKNINQ